MSNTRSPKDELVKKVVKQYSDFDIFELVKSKIKAKNYIEAYTLADQYVTETILWLLVNKKDNIKKLRESIVPVKTLELIERLMITDEKDNHYLRIIKRFRKLRGELVHRSIYGEPIKLTTEFKRLPLEIIQEANLFYFLTVLDLLKIGHETFRKMKSDRRYLDNWHEKSDARLDFFLRYILKRYANKKFKHGKATSKKSNEELSVFISRILGYIFPYVSEKKMGVKRDHEAFYKLVSELIDS